MIRIAAVADLHVSLSTPGKIAGRFKGVNEAADLLLLPGDLTDSGRVSEAQLLLNELADVTIPIFAVLGNHDQAAGQIEALLRTLEEADVRVMDGDTAVLDLNGQSLGIFGTKGTGGGFGKSAFPVRYEPALEVWSREASREAAKIARGLDMLNTDLRVVMLHYAPVRETVVGENPEDFAFMGTSVLCGPIDLHGADVIIHGHSHHGTRRASTPTGIPVHNVAASLLDEPYVIVEVGK